MDSRRRLRQARGSVAEATRDLGAEPRVLDLAALIRRIDEAATQLAQLAVEDDRGSGERTARLGNLAAWQAERERLLDALEAATGVRDVEVARAGREAG